MRRLTHLAVATFCVMPLAVDHSWPAASGIVVLGMAGAVIPDYLDLRSDVRGVLSHRGMSHGLMVSATVIVCAWLVLGALGRVDDPRWSLDEGMVGPLAMAFGVGVVSHLLVDACTPRGIRPFLPISKWRLCLLPRSLRITTGSSVDGLVGLVAFAGAVAVAVLAIAGR